MYIWWILGAFTLHAIKGKQEQNPFNYNTSKSASYAQYYASTCLKLFFIEFYMVSS